jgi:hypothetical protein
MPIVTSSNIAEWKMKEMARRAGKKYEPETQNPFQGLSKEQIKEQSKFLKEAKKSLKADKSEENK